MPKTERASKKAFAETPKRLPSATEAAATRAARSLARHILLFDADEPSTYGPHSLPQASVMSRTTLNPIPWPEGAAPHPTPLPSSPSPNSPLPQFDYLVVTWTVEEAKSLADVLTPGYGSKTDWRPYTHNFDQEFAPIIRRGAPALESKRLGLWFPTSIQGKRVLCFKSDLHMSQDGPKLPVAMLWRQLIAETRPKIVITTGTAGAIGTGAQLGDVVIGHDARFDCLHEFKNAPFHAKTYPCSSLHTMSQTRVGNLCKANADHLTLASRAPKIFVTPEAGVRPLEVVTTDFFAFDDSGDDYKLQGLGAAVEMGDAVLGMVIATLGAHAPDWAAVRNASDPQIDSARLSLKQAATKAAQIYERFGYWTTISSAIACWGLVVDN